MPRRLQRVHAGAQARADVDQLPKAAGQIVSPYLDGREAVAYLRLGSLSALYRQINKNGLPTLRRGGRYLFDRRELDAWLRESRGADLMVVPSARKVG